jgi:BNR repeat protein
VRRALAMAAVAGLTAGLAAITPAATATTVSAMTITLDAPPQPLAVGQQQHSAFPSMVKTPDGQLHLVYRLGSDHYVKRDGAIYRARSFDNGANFQSPTWLKRNGTDYRDPSISYAKGALFLTWYTGSAASPAQGAWVQREWGSPVRIDPAYPYAAITAPVVTLPNGQLGAAFYARKPGESIDTAWMAWSSDEGKTWTVNRIANMIGAGVATNEPYLVVDDAATLFFYRWGSADGIGLRISTDSGKSVWDTPRKILSNASGRPTVLRTSTGALVMVYREVSTRSARLAYSLDHGATWTAGDVVLAAPTGGVGMTYATMFEDSAGHVRGVVGMEQPDGTSRLYGFGLTEGL